MAICNYTRTSSCRCNVELLFAWLLSFDRKNTKCEDDVLFGRAISSAYLDRAQRAEARVYLFFARILERAEAGIARFLSRNRNDNFSLSFSLGAGESTVRDKRDKNGEANVASALINSDLHGRANSRTNGIFHLCESIARKKDTN